MIGAILLVIGGALLGAAVMARWQAARCEECRAARMRQTRPPRYVEWPT